MLSGVHIAPGRQVLTWAHVVKADELSQVGGSFGPFGHPQSEPIFGLCIFIYITVRNEGCLCSHFPSLLVAGDVTNWYQR
jgi:hypothetical protein